jgi:hypothetical protein
LKYLVLAAGILLLLAVASPYLVFIGYWVSWDVYYRFVPVYSASYRIPVNDTTVKLELWSTTGDNDSGRYLTLTSPRGSVRYNMTDFDWAHRARTGLYLVGDGNLAVLGPDDDILISTELKISRAFRLPSDDWIYLGAFDFVSSAVKGHDRDLGFIPAAEQKECIPTYSDQRYDFQPRNSARKNRCP